jgi:WD40 repeat protein
MTPDETFGQTLTTWLHAEAGHRVPDHLGDVLVQTAATRQRKWWTSPERWLPMDTAADIRGRIAAPRSLIWLALIALVILAILATAVATGALRAPGPDSGLSSNGRILVADGPTLKSFAADGTDPKTVLVLPATAEYLVLSHDGTRLGMAVASSDEYMAIVRLADASSTALPDLAGQVGLGSGVTWSPDDQRVAYITYDGSRDHIVIGTSDGSTFNVMATDPIDPSFGLWSPAWSPDGRWLAFVAADYLADNTTGPGTIYLVHPDGTELHALPTAPASAEGGVSWSPDPAVLRLLYTGSGTTPTVRMVDVATGTDQELVTSSWPVWSPNGARFSYGGTEVRTTADAMVGRGTADIAIHTWTDGKSCEEHQEFVNRSFCGPAAFSPDGKRLIAPDITGGSILSVMADGSGQPIVIPLATNVKDLGNPVVWQPLR